MYKKKYINRVSKDLYHLVHYILSIFLTNEDIFLSENLSGFIMDKELNYRQFKRNIKKKVY